MKKLFLLLFVLLGMCNDIDAQDLSLDVQKEAKRQRLMMHRNSDGGRGAYSAYIAAAKYRQQRIEQQEAYLNAVMSAECVTDEATGQTTIKWNDGTAYQGQTYYGEIKGVGTMVYPDKSKYVGSWERDLPNGKGTFQTPEGIMYTVNFENGLPHGKGVIQDLDGRLYSARWVRGKLREKSIKPLDEE